MKQKAENSRRTMIAEPAKLVSWILAAAALTMWGCAKEQSVQDNTGHRRPVATKHLFAVDALGNDLAWAVGFEGTVVHTADGGKTWERQQPPVQQDFYDVRFTAPQHGWIVGKYGTVLKTTDGGRTWVQQQSGTEQRLFDAHFVDENTGWVVGTMGTILHTADGGKRWVSQGWKEDKYYNAVYFIDRQRGWLVGEYSAIYHTEDGGMTWSAQQCADIQPKETEDDFPPPPPHLYDIFFRSQKEGWAAGMDGIIIKTEDGGETWKLLTPEADFSLYQITVQGDRGWAVGEFGRYFESTDGGNTWRLDKSSLRTMFWQRGLKFADSQHGWIVGFGGTIIHTSTGGRDWDGISGIFIQKKGQLKE